MLFERFQKSLHLGRHNHILFEFGALKSTQLKSLDYVTCGSLLCIVWGLTPTSSHYMVNLRCFAVKHPAEKFFLDPADKPPGAEDGS